MNINVINAAIIVIFILPIFFGVFDSLLEKRIQFSVIRLIRNLEFMAEFILSVYLTNILFINTDSKIVKKLYEVIPSNMRQVFEKRHLLVYLVAVPVLMLFVTTILKFVTNPFYIKVIYPLCRKMYVAMGRMNSIIKRAISTLFQVPKALTAVLVFCLLLNISSYYNITWISDEINGSSLYKTVNENVLSPILNSSIAQKVPVLLNDSFKNVIPAPQDAGQNIKQFADNFMNGNVQIIKYFNGMTLDEAIESTDDIDAMAVELTKDQKTDRKKAYAIYKWISQNVKYDNEKAVMISEDPRGIESGSKVAFYTGKGICFDYSCLFISMCRAAGLKVRLITGLAYSGVSWGDHAWNQVYLADEGRWINVDATFGSTVNYFDTEDFEADHVYAEIQGEW